MALVSKNSRGVVSLTECNTWTSNRILKVYVYEKMNSPVYHIAIAPPSIQLLRMKTCTSTFYNRLQTGPPPSHTYLCYNLSPEVKGIVLKISPFTALSTQNLVSFLIGKSKSPAWPLKPSTMWLWSPSPTSFPTHHSFHVHCTAIT